jgi:hypothetical protein
VHGGKWAEGWIHVIYARAVLDIRKYVHIRSLSLALPSGLSLPFTLARVQSSSLHACSGALRVRIQTGVSPASISQPLTHTRAHMHTHSFRKLRLRRYRTKDTCRIQRPHRSGWGGARERASERASERGEISIHNSSAAGTAAGTAAESARPRG